MDVLTLHGAVWAGTRAGTRPGRVVVAADGVIASVGPPGPAAAPGPEVRGAWIGPALVDAHVHLAFGAPATLLAGAVGAVRDLGAPLPLAQVWRASRAPVVAVSGELLTAPGGYPTRGWGAEGFGCGVAGPDGAAAAVRRLVEGGADLVKLALEPADGQPVPDPATCRAVVDAAHAAGLAVTCHALTVAMVERALDAGVDELCHTPTEPLPPTLVARIASRQVPVVSTLQTFVHVGLGPRAMGNARLLVDAGVPLVYGTDLGNAGITPGASADELERVAEAGLGREGALLAATAGAAALAGLAGRVDVEVVAGARTVLVVLTDDPLDDPTAWERPVAVVAAGQVVAGTAVAGSA